MRRHENLIFYKAIIRLLWLVNRNAFDWICMYLIVKELKSISDPLWPVKNTGTSTDKVPT